MSYNLSTTSIGKGINFNYSMDKKFKHNRLTINFITKCDREKATVNALIPFILRQGCEKYTDFLALNRKLANLYGASLSTDISKYGAYQVIDVSIQGIDNRFALNNEDIIKEIATLLCEVALKPYAPNGEFDSHIASLEKQFLFDTIEAEINDKRSYAMLKCKEIMCEGELFAIKKYGYSDEVDGITTKAAYEQYKELVKTSAVEIMMVGCSNPQSAMDIIKSAFEKIDREPQQYPLIRGRESAEKTKEITEKMDVSQSKLVMGFRTGKYIDAKSLNATRLLIALYGATPTSKLFQNVREKLSLCYYCAARMDKITGIMMVDSGVEAQNAEKAKAEILKQLELCKNGEITEEEIHSARLAMKNSLNSVEDGLGSTEDWYMSQIICGTKVSPSEEAKLLDEITVADLKEAASRITLDTIYFLTGNEVAK